MNPTTTLNADTASKLVIDAFVEGPKQAASMLWDDALMPFLSEHWLSIGIFLFVVFVLFTVKAMFGQWGSLGSFLYNLFYFGTLFFIGLIWGPEVFVSDAMNFFTALILYPVCYLIVGWILESTGLKRRW